MNRRNDDPITAVFHTPRGNPRNNENVFYNGII